ncbi:hypothetical protein FG93_05516 [Bosea sp. LC85]|uniref:hypothetical protein n=1 Tax=Bosea sp. LC85 TaxID=1502851 RepID=UPI0004E43B62|nr:hypothetical protein [Bosea sp. LC85]KFC64006.1 hypothetical protein FG93_05516 [Bosea sp. LC85]
MTAALTLTEVFAAGTDVTVFVIGLITLVLRIIWLVVLPVLGFSWLAGWLK